MAPRAAVIRGPPPLIHAPRNARFGPDFPVNEWVNLKITVQAQGWGDIGWKYDPANRLFVVLFNFKDKQVWAYRPKAVAAGTRAK